MSQSHIDPDADPSRRAWLACPNCDHGAGCPECHNRRNCATHWQYLLKNVAARVFLQCPSCLCVWTVDTSSPARQAPTVVRGTRPNACTAVTPRPSSGSDDDRDEAVIAKVWLGDQPRDIVTSPNGEFVYVMTADSVKVLNSFHHIVASIPVGMESKQMMISLDGSRMYVTGYDGSLSVIDPIELTTKAVVKKHSTAAVVSPDGDYIYLAHNEAVGEPGNAWVSAIRSDGASVAFAAVDGFVTGMAVSPNGRRLYVASAGSSSDGRGGSIAVIDTASYNAVGSVAVDHAPETITVDAEGILYVTHFHTKSITVVDPGTYCAIAIAVDDAPMEVVARPETEFVYSANSHSVTVIDTATAGTTSMLLGELPRHLAMSADGRRLYATDFAHGTVWCLDTSDNSVVATVPVCAHPAAVKLSPNGELLYVTDARDGTLNVVSTTLLKPGSPPSA